MQKFHVSIQFKKTLIAGIKIGIGTILAVSLAHWIGIKHPYSTGTIALITLLSSKWDTIRLTIYRLLTFFVTVALTFGVSYGIHDPIVSFGIVLTLLFWFCKKFKLMSTLAVNGVICAHFIDGRNFGYENVINEFLIVLIGVSAALLINQFYSRKMTQKELVHRMKQSEKELIQILDSIAWNLERSKHQRLELKKYEKHLSSNLELAKDFEDNTFQSHTDYYVEYFRMRLAQCTVLKNLEDKLSRLKLQPKQVHTIIHFIKCLNRYIMDSYEPIQQKEELKAILNKMRQEPLPETREEFESRAILFHILMDLSAFVQCKQRFIDDLSTQQKEAYWKLENE